MHCIMIKLYRIDYITDSWLVGRRKAQETVFVQHQSQSTTRSGIAQWYNADNPNKLNPSISQSDFHKSLTNLFFPFVFYQIYFFLSWTQIMRTYALCSTTSIYKVDVLLQLLGCSNTKIQRITYIHLFSTVWKAHLFFIGEVMVTYPFLLISVQTASSISRLSWFSKSAVI